MGWGSRGWGHSVSSEILPQVWGFWGASQGPPPVSQRQWGRVQRSSSSCSAPGGWSCPGPPRTPTGTPQTRGTLTAEAQSQSWVGGHKRGQRGTAGVMSHLTPIPTTAAVPRLGTPEGHSDPPSVTAHPAHVPTSCARPPPPPFPHCPSTHRVPPADPEPVRMLSRQARSGPPGIPGNHRQGTPREPRGHQSLGTQGRGECHRGGGAGVMEGDGVDGVSRRVSGGHMGGIQGDT